MLDSLGYGSAYADDDLDDVDGAGEVAEDEEGADNVVAFPADSRDDEISLDDIDDDLLREDERALTEEDLDEEDLDETLGGPDSVEVAPARVSVETDPVADVEIAPVAIPAAVAELLPEEVDDEIIEVFFEEADEILESLEENIHQWSSEPENRLYLEHMLRGLHTLKGGARLSGLTKLGDEDPSVRILPHRRAERGSRSGRSFLR